MSACDKVAYARAIPQAESEKESCANEEDQQRLRQRGFRGRFHGESP
jgi:hypothetical protein